MGWEEIVYCVLLVFYTKNVAGCLNLICVCRGEGREMVRRAPVCINVMKTG